MSSNGLGGDSEDSFYDSNDGEDGDISANIDEEEDDDEDEETPAPRNARKDALDTQLTNLVTPEFSQKTELAKM